MNKIMRFYLIASCIILLISYSLIQLTCCIYRKCINSKTSLEPSKPIMRMNHLGVIMDGNRRWAKAHGLPSERGHMKGAERFWETIELCLEENIPHLSTYALTSDNVRKRSKEELEHIYTIASSHLERYKEWLIEHNVRIHIVGDYSLFSEEIINRFKEIEQATAHCEKLTVHVLFGYSGIGDCTQAVKNITRRVLSRELKEEDITDEVFEKNMLSESVPPIDFIIRTGNQQRLSAFLPIQSIYSELLFISSMWPETKKEDIRKAIHDFFTRERRFGK